MYVLVVHSSSRKKTTALGVRTRWKNKNVPHALASCVYVRRTRHLVRSPTLPWAIRPAVYVPQVYFFYFSFPSHLLPSPFFRFLPTSTAVVATLPRSHSRSFFPPAALRFVPCIFIARRFQLFFRPWSTRVELCLYPCYFTRQRLINENIHNIQVYIIYKYIHHGHLHGGTDAVYICCCNDGVLSFVFVVTSLCCCSFSLTISPAPNPLSPDLEEACRQGWTAGAASRSMGSPRRRPTLPPACGKFSLGPQSGPWDFVQPPRATLLACYRRGTTTL